MKFKAVLIYDKESREYGCGIQQFKDGELIAFGSLFFDGLDKRKHVLHLVVDEILRMAGPDEPSIKLRISEQYACFIREELTKNCPRLRIDQISARRTRDCETLALDGLKRKSTIIEKL